MSITEKLIQHRRHKVVRVILGLYGVDIPSQVAIGEDVRFEHRGFGIVVHPHTRIGNRVQLFHGVTIGDAVPWPNTPGAVGQILIGDDVTLGAGAKILVSRDTTLTIGDGAVIGANAVVTKDVPAFEIWAGNPARRISTRDRKHVSERSSTYHRNNRE